MKDDKELIGATTTLLILGILARSASYGYEIVRRANEESRGLFEWREGTIYPVLHRLEKAALVRAQWEESDAGRQRKYYHITKSGRAALAQQVEKWDALHALVLRLREA